MIHLFNNFLPTSLTVTVRCHGNCRREEMTSHRFFCHLPTFISLSPPCRLLCRQITFTYVHVPKTRDAPQTGATPHRTHTVSHPLILRWSRRASEFMILKLRSFQTWHRVIWQRSTNVYIANEQTDVTVVFWRCLVRTLVRTSANIDWGLSCFPTVPLCIFRISL